MSRAMRTMFLSLIAALSVSALAGADARADEASAVQLATLMRSELEVVEGAEVIVSLVEVSPATALATHYQPGEEFLYVLEGSGILQQKDKDDVQLRAGDTFKIPLRQVHSAESGGKGMTVLVFRVHEKGQPERILTE